MEVDGLRAGNASFLCLYLGELYVEMAFLCFYDDVFACDASE